MNAAASASHILAIAVMVVGASSGALAREKSEVGNDEVQSAKDKPAADEQRLNESKQFVASGAVPGSRVEQAEIDLAEARISLSVLESNRPAHLDALARLVELRQQRLERLLELVKSGAVPELSARDARIDLAEARIRLDLLTVIALRQENLARIEDSAKAGIVPLRAADEARRLRDESQRRLQLIGVPGGDKPAPPAADNDVIRELLKQRLATAAETRTLAETAYRAGQCGVDLVLEAQAALLSAQLDLAEGKEQRIKIHQEMLQQVEAWSRIVGDQAKANEATTIDVLKAKSRVLESQIALERAKLSK